MAEDFAPAAITSHEPATGAILLQMPPSNIPAAIAAARAAFPAWACQPLSQRVDITRRLTAEIRRNAETLADLMARESGRALWDVHGEIESALARAEASVRAHGERCAQRKQDSGAQGSLAVRHKPLGVIAVITPFAQPLSTPLGQIIPALLAGNAVVFKPSEKALATASALVDYAARAGLPGGLLCLVAGPGEAGLSLATHDEIDAVLFTGSAPTGQWLARKLASRPERLLSLDLGGNNALVVWDTRQIEEAAVLVVQSAFTSAGQRATCARRLIVRDSLAEPLLAAVKRLADRIICGAPHDEQTPFMGPVIDNETADALIESAIWLMSNGGRPIKHMTRLADHLPFITPAIIDVTDMAERPDVELFGPLLQVIRVSDFDEAIAQANATRYGLVAGLIGGTQADYNKFWANIRAGLVHWNRATTAEVTNAPIGGIGLSGNLRAGGTYAADHCAYPVASLESENLRAMLGTGFAAEV